MVVAGHPLAVQSGLKVLRDGGTACDAAVATATMLSIMMTDMMGPLGSGYAVIYEAQKKELSAIDFNGVAPAATDPKKFDMAKKRRGIMAPTVPGTLKGWEEVHKKCGSLAVGRALAGCDRLCRERPAVDNESHFHIKRHMSGARHQRQLGQGVPGQQDAAAGAGLRLEAPGLSPRATRPSPQRDRTPSTMASRRQDRRLHGEGRRPDHQGGPDEYEVKWNAADQDQYRGHTVYGVPPSSSSITWMQILNIVEGYDLKALRHNSPEYLHVFIEATKHAYMDGYRYNGDPAFVKCRSKSCCRSSYAAEDPTEDRRQGLGD